MSDAPAVEVAGLSKSFGPHAAVSGLDMVVERGQITGFVGPNGAGKTTTLRMLLGLIRPSAGRARVLGHSIDEPAAYLKRVGALIEAPALYPALSGRANLIALQRLGRLPKARVEVTLEQVGLTSRAGDHVKSYSLGMKQRLAIAGALLPEPDLLVLDEPTNGLDPAGIREIRALLRGLADGGAGVLISSHLLSEIQTICDDLVMIRAGEVVYQGSVADLLTTQETHLLLRPSDPAATAQLLDLISELGFSARHRDGALEVAGGREAAAELNSRAFQAGILLEELRVEVPSLEEAFFAVEGQQPAEPAFGAGR